MGCDHQAAEDAVQTTLVKCFVSWSKVQRADDPDAYVTRILVNTIKSDWRRPGRKKSVLTDHVPETRTEDPTAAVDTDQALRFALSRLSMGARQVVVLRHVYGLSEQQTADVLSLPSGTVKSRLSRALAQLAADPQLAVAPERRAP
jgi:RNA polymerase sigma-70 factor (sigma-E family)